MKKPKPDPKPKSELKPDCTILNGVKDDAALHIPMLLDPVGSRVADLAAARIMVEHGMFVADALKLTGGPALTEADMKPNPPKSYAEILKDKKK
jgi:hypothetical protein